MDLLHILDELEDSQLDKLLLFYLTKIPQSKKDRPREKVCQLILEHYGPEQSVSIILEAMNGIPRMDQAVRDLLQPHVDRLKDKENRANHGNKRPAESDSDSDSETVHRPKAGRKKRQLLSDSSDFSSGDEEEKTCKSEQEVKIPVWRKTVQDVINCAVLESKKVMVGKLVQKSGLRKYQTKEKQTKFFFYLAVADHTECIKAMVYGMECYEKLEQGRIYTFRDVMIDDGVMKVTRHSTVSETRLNVDVPENIEVRAETLVYPQSPVCSISDAKTAPEKSTVSVEGTVEKINKVSEVKLKNKRRRMKPKQDFWLTDGTDSVQVCLWDKDIQQLRDKIVGDIVRVTNVRTSRYYDTTSLNSTFYTRIIKVSGAAVQNISVEVIGVVHSSQKETQLEVEFNKEVASLFIQSRVLAQALGIRLEGDFKERLLDQIPLSAKVEIKGNRINVFEVV